MIKVEYKIFNADDEVVQQYEFHVDKEESVNAIDQMMNANSKNRYEYTWHTV